MMKVLFIYPDVITKMINFCPAIHVLSAWLKKHGHGVDLLHINNDGGIKYNKDAIISKSHGYDLYAITSTSFNYKYANEIAGWLKEASPDTLRILGGSHATIQPEDFEQSNFDIFCVGEGEMPMLDLLNAMESKSDYTKIPNLITRSGTNPVRGFLRDLNALPFWDFDITDTARILELRKGWMSISFSRGCNYSCTFCINHLYKKIEIGADDKMSDYLRRRKPELVVEELRLLADEYDIEFFNIDDDLLTTNKRWMKEFTDGYLERIYKPYGIKYVINARADTLTEDIVKMLADSGCKEARIGFETGNEQMRNELLQKKTTDESLEKAFATLKKHGVMSVAFSMIGIPDESWDTFWDTVHSTIRLKPALMRMTFLFPYKHTRIYDICVEKGMLKDGYENEDNRDLRSPLKFDKITDQGLFCFRFLFPWFVNAMWYKDADYINAITEFISYPLDKLETMVGDIIIKDNELSAKCDKPHYRYYKNNPDYFELK